MDITRTDNRPLDEQTLSQDAPFVRALVAARLEVLWQQVNGHIQSRADVELEPDVRVVEAGVRILKSLSSLYRLDSPAGTPEELVGGTNLSTRALVAAQLDTLEQRMRQDEHS